MYALIDADILVFRCGMAAERKIWHLSIPAQDYTAPFEYKREAMEMLDKLLPGLHSREEGKDYTIWPEVDLQPLSHALQNVKTLMARILNDIQCNDFDVRMCLSPDSGGTFRHKLATTRVYKGNRDKSHRPTYEKEIRDYIKKNWDTTVAVNEEADDLLGIMQTKYGPEDSVIVTIDKDLDMIPGLKYNFVKEIAYNITEAQAVKNFHLQLMIGDSTDNIVGLPGIGPAKAEKALHGIETPAEQQEEVVRMYQIHSGKEDWEAYLLEMGQLIYIRQQVGEMWEPAVITNTEADWGQEEVSMYGD